MGVPKGVVLIVGGGYHGKSTLLSAIEQGIYNHRPGDGRERVVSRHDASKVRAEDGRSVAGVDLSPFIGTLPGNRDSSHFSTENASGSSSQAASIIETIETGSKLLLLDEDISATNLLIRDARMQQLIAPDKEPITPFVQRIRSIYEDIGVSTILVLGGSGDYFEAADRVIAMDNYRPKDLTQEAKALCTQSQIQNLSLQENALSKAPSTSKRKVDAYSFSDYFDPRARNGRFRMKVRDKHVLSFGDQEIDLSLNAQVIDNSQLRAAGQLLVYAIKERLFERYPLPQALERALESFKGKPLSEIGRGDLAEVRLQELCSALNRLRSLQIKQ